MDRMKIWQRILVGCCCLALGLLVFVIFSHYFPYFKRWSAADVLGRIITASLLLGAALAARRSTLFQRYWLILFAFFTAIFAISLDLYLSFSQWLLPALKVSENSPAGLAIDKLESSALGIAVILILNRLAGQPLNALYIRRGNLRLGLVVGLAAFAAMLAGLIPVTELFFNGQNLTWGRILPWLPWVLLMVLANAANEELLFRGQMIGKLQPFVGKFATNLITTMPFVVMHAGNNYMSDSFIFLVLQLLPLSLAWCWLMQKTNSIWGSLLFHAAMDIPIFVGIFSRL